MRLPRAKRNRNGQHDREDRRFPGGETRGPEHARHSHRTGAWLPNRRHRRVTAGRVRSTQPPDLENVGDQCALIMNASRTLIRFSAQPRAIPLELGQGAVKMLDRAASWAQPGSSSFVSPHKSTNESACLGFDAHSWLYAEKRVGGRVIFKSRPQSRADSVHSGLLCGCVRRNVEEDARYK
jgi:hypothetical protein